ncbi:MAG: hypothetical protein AAFR23_09980, partial [Pseudomonadota bacterium]
MFDLGGALGTLKGDPQPWWQRVALTSAPFSIVLTGLEGGVAEIGSEASIGFTITPDNGTETVKWSDSANSADPATYGTGANPTDFSAGDGARLYLHVLDNGDWVTRSASIKYPVTLGALSDVAAPANSGTQVINASTAFADPNLSWTYELAPLSGLTISATTGEITVDRTQPHAVGTEVTVTGTNQYDDAYDVSFDIT